jgi:hypothetical protein
VTSADLIPSQSATVYIATGFKNSASFRRGANLKCAFSIRIA